MSLIKKATFLVSLIFMTMIATLVAIYFLSQFESKLSLAGTLNGYEIVGTLVILFYFLISLPRIMKKIVSLWRSLLPEKNSAP